MQEKDRLELIRINELSHINPVNIFTKTLELLNKEIRTYSDDINSQNRLMSLRLSSLANGLKSYYLSNGALNENINDILAGCFLNGRIMLISGIFAKKANITYSTYIWDILFSIMVNDTKCINSFYKLYDEPSNYTFEIKSIENGIRELFLKSNKIDLSKHKMFTKKSKNKFLESSIQIVRDYVNNNNESFESNSKILLKNYRMWASSNNLFEEISIPIRPLALIRFGIDYCGFNEPNLNEIDKYAISNSGQLLCSKLDKSGYEEITNLWPKLFSLIDDLPENIEVETIFDFNQKNSP